MKIILNNLLTFIHSFIHSFILTRTYSSVYWVQEQCIHTWFNLNCSSTVGVWHWVDYTPATQVRRRLRASSQRELIETDLNWNIDDLSDSSCSTSIPGSEITHVTHMRNVRNKHYAYLRKLMLYPNQNSVDKHFIADWSLSTFWDVWKVCMAVNAEIYFAKTGPENSTNPVVLWSIVVSKRWCCSRDYHWPM